MNVKAAIAAATVALACATPAQAETWTPEQYARAYQIADGYWPDSQCHGRENVDEVHLADMPWLANVAGVLKWQGQCDVTLVPENIPDATTLCGVLVHEFGHAAGLEHSPDPTNVMYFQLVIAPECVQAFAPPPAVLPAPAIKAHKTSRARLLLRLARSWGGRRVHKRHL